MILEILKAGLLALEDYVGKHILTCLVPAFLLAGAIVSFINRSLIIKYLGSSASKHNFSHLRTKYHHHNFSR